jgi:hypothetical protein
MSISEVVGVTKISPNQVINPLFKMLHIYFLYAGGFPFHKQ